MFMAEDTWVYFETTKNCELKKTTENRCPIHDFLLFFSRMHPKRHFSDFCTILNTCSKTFGEVFGEGLKY